MLTQNCEIWNGESNMAEQNAKSYLIGMKFGTWRVFGVTDYESKTNI